MALTIPKCQYNKYYFWCLTRQVDPISSQDKSTEEYKQGGTPPHLYSLTQSILREREILVHQKEERRKCMGFTLLWLRSIPRNFCVVFSLVVSLRKIFVFLCAYVFVIFLLSMILIVTIFLRYHLIKLRNINRGFTSHEVGIRNKLQRSLGTKSGRISRGKQ